MATRTLAESIAQCAGSRVRMAGWCHKLRDLGGLTFVVLRDRTGLCQLVLEGGGFPRLALEDCIEIEGIVREEPRAPGGTEVLVDRASVLSAAAQEPVLQVNTRTMQAGLDACLDNRALSLRHATSQCTFRVQQALVSGFRCLLKDQGFAEVFTPKLVAQGTEGGAELFRVDYFGKVAYLAQSPQFYKQTLVGAGFERVFETGHAYRAEEHSTSRHLNEYVSLDVEMGFIDSVEDLMRLEEQLLAGMFARVVESCSSALEGQGVDLSALSPPASGWSIPRIPLAKAQEVLATECGKRSPEGNLDPEGEKLICEHAARTSGSDFVFITEYPRRKRPMYAKPMLGRPDLTESFDLLYRGLEVTTGGLRIHLHDELVDSMRLYGLDPRSFEHYLVAFRYGMPPHGGFAIGLERLTARMMGLHNVREASLFPRDRERLAP